MIIFVVFEVGKEILLLFLYYSFLCWGFYVEIFLRICVIYIVKVYGLYFRFLEY